MLYFLTDGQKRPCDYSRDPASCDGRNEKDCKKCHSLERYILHLRKWIRETCEAHTMWIRGIETTAKECFLSYYWVNGTIILDGEDDEPLQATSLMDTPLQIIKCSKFELYDSYQCPYPSYTGDFDAWFSQFKEHRHHRRQREPRLDSLRQTTKSWIISLQEEDNRAKYVFARRRKTKSQKYQLADHVWIYQAVQSIEEGCKVFGASFSDLDPHSYLCYPDSDSGLTHSPSEELRRVILRRFTTQNPRSKQRMIATSRTPHETRFLLHAKDTALFYAMDLGFFDRELGKNKRSQEHWVNKVDVWKDTIDAQGEHEETQNLDWEKPLWYAVALIAGLKRKRIGAVSAEQMLDIASNVLMGTSSVNGLFPGFLDGNHAPVPFKDDSERNSYWNTTFELPYVLWRYGRAHLEAQLSQVNQIGPSGPPINRDPALMSADQTRDTNRLRHPMTKKVVFANFTNLIDQKRLVEVSDDWLEVAPASLDFNFAPDVTSYERLEPTLKKFREKAKEHFRSIELYRIFFSRPEGPSAADMTRKGLVIDVGKRSTGRESQTKLTDNEKLWEALKQPRTVQKAKKRIVWLPRGDWETAKICTLASSELERDNMTAFFDRHADYEKYFFDEATAAMNEWVTEMHLSYFQKFEGVDFDLFRFTGPGALSIPDLTYVEIERKTSATASQDTSAHVRTVLARKVASFRFVGDFFDRYWTCHFLEYSPQEPFKILPIEAQTASNSEQNTQLHFLTTSKDFREELRREDEKREDLEIPDGSTSAEMSQEAQQEDHCTDGNTRSPNSRAKHLLSSITGAVDNLHQYLSFADRAPSTRPQHSDRDKHHWQQRKVLELLLLDKILEDMISSNQGILAWAQDSIVGSAKNTSRTNDADINGRLRKGERLPAKDPLYKDSFVIRASGTQNPLQEALESGIQSLKCEGSDSYFSWAEHWKFFDQALQNVEEDLHRNLEIITDWTNRENDRGLEKPRWTRNDEKTYRRTLNKLRLSNQHKVRQLEQLKARTQAFRSALTGKLSSMREDISFRGSENINLFTYVTVVFLPLGFAASIFSMGGAPDATTLTSMIVTAIVALYLTIGALVNAKPLDDSLVEPIVKPVMRRTGQAAQLITSPVIYSFCRYAVLPLAGRSKESWFGKRILRFLEALERLQRQHSAPVTKAKKDYQEYLVRKSGRQNDQNLPQDPQSAVRGDADDRPDIQSRGGRRFRWHWFGRSSRHQNAPGGV